MDRSEFVLPVTDNTFNSLVLQSVRPVLVYFWAEWCEECRYMSPVIASVAGAKGASVQVVTLEVDENPRMARQCLIQMVPTMLLYMMGKERERIEGLTNQAHLSSTIDMHLSDAVDDEISDQTNSVN